LVRVTTMDTVVTVMPIVSTAGTLVLVAVARLGMQLMRKRLEREHVAWPL
jgi:hypothetical protein